MTAMPGKAATASAERAGAPPCPAADAGPAAAGPWYPEPPPRLPGEEVAAWQARLAAGGPFDHARSPACAAGQHGACPARPGRECQCPHHADTTPDITAIPAIARSALTAGACELTAQYGLPEATGLRLMILTRQVACGGRRPPARTLQARIGAAYGTHVSGQFTAAVTAIYQAAVTRDPE